MGKSTSEMTGGHSEIDIQTCKGLDHILRGSAVVTRVAHNHENNGSIPFPATKKKVMVSM